MRDRLQMLLKEYGLTSAKFADALDIQPSAISHILSGRNKPGFDLLSKILSAYPEVNPRWLILGEGSIFTSPNPQRDLGENKTLGIGPVFEPETERHDDLFSSPITETPSILTSSTAAVTVPENDQEENPHISDTIKPSVGATAGIRTVIIFYNDGTFESFGNK